MKKVFVKISVVIIAIFIFTLAGVYFVKDKKEAHNKFYFSADLNKTNNLNNANDLKSECKNIPQIPDGAKKLVTKVIDGDTFLIEDGYSVRILGIDADERGYSCYDSAKNKLEELILNKEVKLEKGVEDKDQYCRYLRYVFLDGKNIGLELVKEGLAVARFSSKDIKYREGIISAEKYARENKIGCKWSEAKIEDKNLTWEKLTPEKLNVKVVNACFASNYIGKEIILEGKVVSTYRSPKSNTVFLNFEKPYPNQCFSAVIFNSDLYKFVKNPENYYLNKTVRVFGKIQEYQGKPEIILKNASQIEIGK
jgi:endonuclease YncB( thermonuclease family)